MKKCATIAANVARNDINEPIKVGIAMARLGGVYDMMMAGCP